MNTHQVFVSERLVCRRWRADDLQAIYAVYSDELGSRWVDDGQPITLDECERWLDVTQQNYIKRGYGMFALDERSSGATIGFCGLVHPDDQPEAEIKYAFLRSHWGQGFASEAVPHLLAYGAAAHDLTQIIATVAAENLASRRVLAKLGMTHTRTLAEDDGTETLVYEWQV